MKQNRLVHLLNRSVTSEVTEAEREEMLRMLTDPVHEAEAKDALLEVYMAPKSLQDLPQEKSKQILEAIFHSETGVNKPPVTRLVPLYKWALVAASLILCLSIGLYFYNGKDNKGTETAVAATHDVLPGKQQATLTLADGSVVVLNEIPKGKVLAQAGMRIVKKDDGQLYYELTEAADSRIAGNNTITTPMGGKYEVKLQDGTRVVLNAGSSITYPISFAKNSRRVTLKGEAYFEVAKDKNRPFTVVTPASLYVQAQEIQVLGTHFNLTAYADETAYVTTLLEGSVNVRAADGNSRTIRPGEQAVLKKQIVVSKADMDAAIAWKDDIFYFADEPIEPLMRKISRWYDVEIIYKGAAPEIGFWGQISRNKKLSEVLAVLEQTNGVHFKIEGRRVTVMQ